MKGANIRCNSLANYFSSILGTNASIPEKILLKNLYPSGLAPTLANYWFYAI